MIFTTVALVTRVVLGIIPFGKGRKSNEGVGDSSVMLAPRVTHFLFVSMNRPPILVSSRRPSVALPLPDIVLFAGAVVLGFLLDL